MTLAEQNSADTLLKTSTNYRGKIQGANNESMMQINLLFLLNILFQSVPKYEFPKLCYKVEGFVYLSVSMFSLWLLEERWSLSLKQ
jgi:hypothetical protein